MKRITTAELNHIRQQPFCVGNLNSFGTKCALNKILIDVLGLNLIGDATTISHVFTRQDAIQIAHTNDDAIRYVSAWRWRWCHEKAFDLGIAILIRKGAIEVIDSEESLPLPPIIDEPMPDKQSMDELVPV
jgi:hypothetical protein